MRRPTLCCDHQSTAVIEDQTCKEQGGTLARVRRLFFSSPLGRRSSTGGSSSQPLKPPPPHHYEAGGGRGGRGSSSTGGDVSLTPLRLNHCIGVVMEEMVGSEVEELIKTGGKTGGIPTLLHQLTSYILNHDVNIAALLYEDFNSSDIRLILNSNIRNKTVEGTNVAQLLRYFIEELPSPLLPQHTVASLMSLAEGHSIHAPEAMRYSQQRQQQQQQEDAVALVDCKARRILHRDVTQMKIEMIKHITEFLSCLHHANRCELDGASVLLSSALVGRNAPVRCVGKALGVYFLSHQEAIFKETTETMLMSSSSSAPPQHLLRPSSSSSSTNDEEDEESTSSSSSSRSSTSGDTEDYRSPQLSPNRSSPTSHQYVLLPEGELLSPEGEMVSSCGEEEEEGGGRLGGGGMMLHSSNFPTDEGDPMDDGSSSSSIRSTNIGDLANIPTLSFSCDLKSEDNTLLCSSKDNCSRSDDTALESDGTGCGLSDPWEDFTTSGGEIYTAGGGEEDSYSLQDNANLSDFMGESHRFSERTYYPASRTTAGVAAGEYSSPQHHHKKKKSKHRQRHSKEGGALCSSSASSKEKLTAPSNTQSEEEDEVTIVASHDNIGIKENNSLSSLLDHNEPVVASDRGRWSVGQHDYDHKSVQFNPYSRYGGTEAHSSVESSEPPTPWYKYEATEDPPAVDTNRDTSYSSHSHRFASSPSHHPPPSAASSSSFFLRAVTGKAAVSTLHKNISSLKKKIKRFEEEFEQNNGYKPSHSDKMKHKDIKKYMSDLNKYRKEMKMLKEGVADLMSSKGFSLSLLRCQESTQNNPLSQNTIPPPPPPRNSTSSPPPAFPSSSTCTIEHQKTLQQVEDRLREARALNGRPLELSFMNMSEMQEEKTALQKALLYYESIHGRPTSRDIRELARPLYDRYRQVKRNVTRAQSRAKENLNELAPIIEHVAMDFTLASPQHRSSLVPDTEPITELLQCTEMLMEVKREREEDRDDCDDEDGEGSDNGKEGSLSDSSDMSKQSTSNNSTALSNLHSLPLHELKERRKEVKDQKKKLRRSLRQFEEKYEREHGHKLAKEDRGIMELTYADYKHAKAKLRLLEALISKKAPKEFEF